MDTPRLCSCKRENCVPSATNARTSLHVTSFRYLLLVEAASLRQEGLAGLGFTTDSGESLDAQSSTGLLHSGSPLVHVAFLLSGSARLLGDDLAPLVPHEIGLLETTASLFLLPGEDSGLAPLALRDLADLHGPLHATHGHLLHAGLHGLHALHTTH